MRGMEYDKLFPFLAQRDESGSAIERSYWRGYFDALAEHEGVDLSDLEAAYEATIIRDATAPNN